MPVPPQVNFLLVFYHQTMLLASQDFKNERLNDGRVPALSQV